MVTALSGHGVEWSFLRLGTRVLPNDGFVDIFDWVLLELRLKCSGSESGL